VPGSGVTALRVPLPADFDFGWTIGFLAARTLPSIESTGPAWYRRVQRLPNGAVVELEITHDDAALVVRAGGIDADAAGRMVRRMFDLDADLEAFQALAAADPVLGPIVRGNPAGLRLPQLLDPFEALTRAIINQQVSVAAARTVTDRLVRMASDGEPLAFPRAARVAELGVERLRSIGLTGGRASTLHGVADAIARGGLDLPGLADLPEREAERALCALPGIGPWTAGYVRMRSLGARDAFPAADLGVIRALEAAGIPRRAVAKVAEGWRPWRGYATIHLWASEARRLRR
jgi:AraC family transcriptional regulator, regulatory protein of adaptative response / DNA-3-methyladenine glycosylase II